MLAVAIVYSRFLERTIYTLLDHTVAGAPPDL
jgi:hypothetical protein